MPPNASTSRREAAAAIKLQAEAAERRRTAMLGGAIALVVAVLGVLLFLGLRDADSDGGAAGTSARGLESVSGLGQAAQPPWPAPVDTAARVAAAGMSLGAMGMADHYHVHLDVLVDGKPVTVVQNLGVDPQSGAMAGLHTHSSDGLVHIEATTKGQPFTLGQLFTTWDVQLSTDQIGSLNAGDGKTLRTYVNGEQFAGNPAMLRLAKGQQITLVFGDADASPDIASSYDFGPDL